MTQEAEKSRRSVRMTEEQIKNLAAGRVLNEALKRNKEKALRYPGNPILRPQKPKPLNAGMDSELLIDGMTIAGAHIESGVRSFADYAKAMIDDFGSNIKPYLLSFYEAARAYPGIDKEGMSAPEESAKLHQSILDAKETNVPDERSGNDLERDSANAAPRNGVG